MDELSEAGGWFNHGVGPARRSEAGDPPEADLAAMLDAMTLGVVLARRPDGGRPHPIIVWTNHALRALTGLAERDLVGARLRRLRGAEPSDPAFAALVNAITHGEAWSGDLLVAGGKGAGSRLFARTAPLPDGRQSIVTLKSGNPQRDVAEPVDLPAISRMLGDLLHGGLYRLGADIDAGLRLEWADQTVERVTGYPLAELQARGGLSGIVVPRDRAKVRKRNLELMSGVSSEISYRIETSQGVEVRLIDRARPLRSHSVVPAGAGLAIERAVGTLRLVLPERDDLPAPGLPFADFKLLADLLGATLLAVDADLRVLWVTACEDDGFGQALQGHAAVQLDDVLGGDLLEEWQDHVEQVLTTGRRVEAQFQ